MQSDVILIRTPRFGDERGWFQEVWSRQRMAAFGLDYDFVQDNQSLSVQPGVVRGLHFQRPPMAQAKLVRCVRGAILDVVVDLRRGAPTFGHSYTVRLDDQSGEQLLVPPHFAHGFMTLMPHTEVAYKVTAPYAPDHEGGVAWDDAALSIDWPFPRDQVQLSERDRLWPRLAELDTPFSGQGPSQLRRLDLTCAVA